MNFLAESRPCHVAREDLNLFPQELLEEYVGRMKQSSDTAGDFRDQWQNYTENTGYYSVYGCSA